MVNTTRTSTGWLIASLLLLGCGPFVMIAGGKLSGIPTRTPDNWAFTQNIDTVQLETRPEDPYSVNLWMVDVKDRAYVGGSTDSTWTANAVANPEVRLRVDDAVYELNAVAVTDKKERSAVVLRYVSKYDWEEDSQMLTSGILFRLDRRSQ